MYNKVIIIGLVSSFVLLEGSAQSVLGIWKTVDDEDGTEKSKVEIFEQDGLIFGKVIELLPAADGTHCEKCKGELKGAPVVGMQILWDMEAQNKAWKGGFILDPNKGKEYRCVLSLEDPNTLKVRGYIGTPWLGRTQYWYRAN